MRFQFAPVFSALLAVLMLSACSTAPPVKTTQKERVRLYLAKSDQLAVLDAWRLEGRLAISNKADGGSGQFRWAKSGESTRMDFHGALGRGAWELSADERGAQLTLADGTVHHADSIDRLVRQQLEWEVPVDSLAWWVRGLATPGGFKEQEIDAEGNLTKLLQDDWSIEFGRYREFENISLPVRLTAYRGEWKVKLAIRSWELTPAVIEDD